MTSADYKLLQKIDNPRHYLATSDMAPEELILASKLEDKHWIELVPASHGVSQSVVRDSWGDPISYGPRLHSPISRKLPERYVMLSGGDHALEAFEGMTLSEEMRQWRRKERRPSLLQEWNNVTTKPLDKDMHPLKKCQISGHHLKEQDHQGKCTRCGYAGGGR